MIIHTKNIVNYYVRKNMKNTFYKNCFLTTSILYIKLIGCGCRHSSNFRHFFQRSDHDCLRTEKNILIDNHRSYILYYYYTTMIGDDYNIQRE